MFDTTEITPIARVIIRICLYPKGSSFQNDSQVVPAFCPPPSIVYNYECLEPIEFKRI
jgi:hypothetical protein